MRVFVGIFSLLLSVSVSASEFDTTDQYISDIVLSALNSKKTSHAIAASRSSCFLAIKSTITQLLSCKKYLSEIYVTDDIDAYVEFIINSVQYGLDPYQLNEFSKLISAEYDEVNSNLYYRIGQTYYRLGKYNNAVSFLKKIDDTLDEASVYKALLVYGLIYFEKNEFKKSKYHLGRIDSTSESYKYARYNLALISMRSGWWAEAEENLNKAMSSINLKKMTRQEELLLDKIYITLGYSHINRKNFRSAKKSFNKITLDSSSINRAMIGLAMSEIGLGNLEKAAPLLKYVLKQKDTEEYLDALVILPQVYHQANNIKFTVKYYKQALSALKSIELDNKRASNNQSLDDNHWMTSQYNRRVKLLDQLSEIKLTDKAKKVLLNAKKSLDIEHKSYLNKKANIYNTVVSRYIKQVKYALAAIYDNSVANNE